MASNELPYIRTKLWSLAADMSDGFEDHDPGIAQNTRAKLDDDLKTPVSPPSGLRHLLRRGYEGQEGFYRQAGLPHGYFTSPPAKIKSLAVIRMAEL